VALINSSVLTAGVKKAQGANHVSNPLDGAKVTIRSFDTSGNLVQTVETVTNAQGGFAGSVDVRDGGGIVNVKIEKGNVISYEKTFPYKTAADLSAGLQLKAELDPLLVKVLSTGVTPQVGFDTAAVDDMVSIAVVEDRRGNRQIVGGKSIAAAKAAGGTINWQLDVAKVVFANASTTSLTVKAQNYNPAREEDMKRFPAQDDDTGNRLVSAAFDFIDIKDQNGKALSIPKATAKAVRKSAAVAYRVKKQIPDCSLIVKDEDSNKAGVQIGFYFMRNGKWNKLGTATLYKDSTPDDANLFQMSDVQACSSRPYAVLTDADISKDIDFDLRWFNFDYVAFGEIETACVAGTFTLTKNGAETPLGGVSVNLTKLQQGTPPADVTGFRSAYGYSASDGTFQLDFTYTADSLSSPTATLSYYDPVTYQTRSMVSVLTTKNAKNCYVIDPVTIAGPECSVTGRVLTASGAPAAGRYVNIYQPGYYYGSQWTTTDSSGTYSKEVFCSTGYELSVDGITKSFTVNGTQAGDEKSDTGTLVTMNDIQKTNKAPNAYIWASNDSVRVNEGVSLYGYGYDPDGDALTYLWTVEPGCGGFAAASGASTTATSTQQSVRWVAPATPPSDNTCTITLKVSDGSLTGTATSDIYVSQSGNRPPVITWLYVPKQLRAGTAASLYVSAYDANNDPLTYSWSTSCGTISDPSLIAPSFTPPSSGSCDVTATVSDGIDQVSRTESVEIIPNRGPQIVSMFVPATVGFGKSRTFSAYAFDPDFDTVSYAWSATCGSFANATTSSPTWTAPDTENTSCTITLAVSDGTNQTTQTKTVTTTANTSPVITGVSAPATVNVSSQAQLSGTATDADGDQLSWSWTIQSGSGTLSGTCSGTATGGVNTSSCSYVAPAGDETATLRFSVSDGRAAPVTRDVTITVTSITGGFGITVR